jgi:uncharacterized protein YjdB
MIPGISTAAVYQTFISASNDPSENLDTIIDGVEVQAQSFLPTSTGYIKGVNIKATCGYAEYSPWNAKICNIDPVTNLPDTDNWLACSDTIYVNSGTANLDNWTSFHFTGDNQVLLNTETQYALVVTMFGNNYYEIQATSGDMYSAGVCFSGYFDYDLTRIDMLTPGPEGCDLVFQVICSNMSDVEPPTFNTATITPDTITEGPVSITANASDTGSGINEDSYRWAVGTYSAVEDFLAAATAGSGRTYAANANGSYMVYVEDLAGNKAIQTININNIGIVGVLTANNDPSANLQPILSGDWVQAQTFIPAGTGYIKGVNIKATCGYVDDAPWNAKICNIDPATNLPDTDNWIACSDTIYVNSGTANLDNWTSFRFTGDNQVLLNEGTQYALVITMWGNDYYYIQATSGDAYPDGECFSGYYDTNLLEIDPLTTGPAGYDLVFQVICSEPPEPVLNSLEITNLPDKTNYSVGESLDLTGLVVMGNYSDGTREVTITETNISDFDSSQANPDQIVTITVDGKTANFHVSIGVQPVTQIIVSGSGGTTNVALNGTLQMIAEILPSNATDKSVTWSVNNGTGTATIDADGLLTSIQVGTVTVTATANDSSGVVGSLTVNVIRPVLAITVSGDKNATIVAVNSTLQMNASIAPKNATEKTVSWEVSSGTGSAIISDSGLLTGLTAGTVTVIAIATDGSGVRSTLDVNIINPVTGITVTGENNATTLAVNSSLKMMATVYPAEATDQTVTWSVKNSSGRATIDASGLLTGTKAGNVTVTATANDGSRVKGSLAITITK